jgi:hypothetical protein
MLCKTEFEMVVKNKESHSWDYHNDGVSLAQ